MAPFLSFLISGAALASTSLAKIDQKLLGPSFELPTNVPSSQVVQNAVTNITDSLNTAIRSGKSPFGAFNGSTTSFSLTVVSQHDAAPILDFHHTSDAVNVSAGSTSKVTADTVYRIGSVSKLLTVYALLLNQGFEHWNSPVTDFIPELREAAKNIPSVSSIIDHVQWDQVTVGALASQLSGIGRDYNGDLATQDFPWEETGLPILPPQDLPICAANDSQGPCSRSEFFHGYTQRHPVFLPYSTALYSNSAYRILAYVIEAIAKKPDENVMLDDIFKPLGLTKSSVLPPKDKGVGVIPIGEAGWFRNYGDEVATGGLLSSANDLAHFGRAIFANKQLSSTETLRWMKPQAHTASPLHSVGAAWEIARTKSGITTGHVIDLYTKLGSVGLYQSLLILVPDYQVTFAILAAGPDSSTALHIATETAVQTLIPALEKTASAQSCERFCGEYKPANVSANSSLVINVDDQPGLLVKEWISRGSDLLATAQAYADATQGGKVTGLRLFPTGIKTKDQAAYRALFQIVPHGHDPSIHWIFDPTAETWVTVDGLMYGEIAVDDFVFHFDDQGGVTAIEPRVLREAFQKVRGSS